MQVHINTSIQHLLLGILDQLGGWSLRSIGEGYGRGYNLDVLHKWLIKIDSKPSYLYLHVAKTIFNSDEE